MKKIYTLITALIFAGTFVSAQCTIDNTDTVLGISPPDTIFPKIIRNVTLDSTYVAQIYVPATYSFTYMSIPITATVRRVVISDVAGFPNGIVYYSNPHTDTIPGGTRQCILLSGTTSDPVGTYPLVFDGFVTVNTIFTGDTTFPLSLLGQLGTGFNYNLYVIDPAGINEINAALSSAITVVPNPNNGKFEFRLDAHHQIAGELKIVDATGREVFNQKVETNNFYSTSIDLSRMSKGLYSLQFRSSEGFAVKNISVE